MFAPFYNNMIIWLMVQFLLIICRQNWQSMFFFRYLTHFHNVSNYVGQIFTFRLYFLLYGVSLVLELSDFRAIDSQTVVTLLRFYFFFLKQLVAIVSAFSSVFGDLWMKSCILLPWTVVRQEMCIPPHPDYNWMKAPLGICCLCGA